MEPLYVLPLETRTTRRQRDARRGWGNVRKRIVRTRFREELNRASSATRRTRIAREEGGRAAVLRRPRGVIVSPRVRARSRGLSTDARGGRARARVPGKHSRSARNGQRKNMASLRRPCRTGGARTRTHLSPCPSFHESLNPPAATLRSTRDMTWKGGSAASASDALVMAPAAPPGTLCHVMRAFRPDSPRAPRPPRVRPTARGRALPPAEPCPTVRTAVRRARGCGATNAAAPGLARDAGAVAVAHRNSARKSRPSMPSRVGQEKRVDQNLAVRHRWTRFNVQKSYDVLYMGIWSGNATDFLANGSAGFWIHARVANAASRTDTAFLLGRKSRTVVEENATSALQRAVLARAIPTPPTLPIRA
jgi:hypothetical protein